MNKKTWMLQITGWTLLVFSVTALAVVETDSLLSKISYNKILGYIAAATLFLAGGIAIIASFIIQKRNKKNKDCIDIFKILTKYSGQITPSEFSVETGLDFNESRKKLDDMYKNGVCKIHVTESGILIYYFPDFEIEQSAIIH